MSAAAIFSDIHLPNIQNEDYRLFLQTLKSIELRQDVSEVWLLGDIFDCLIGEQDFWVTMHQEFWQQLESLAKAGKKVLYFEGNHDFAFKKTALRHGVHVHTEGRCHLFQGRRVFLSHGDENDTDNETYARWRKFTKSSAIRRTYQMVPSRFTQKVLVPCAEMYSSKSKKQRGPASSENEVQHYREKYRTYAGTVIRERAYNAVFLGHSHIKELETFGSVSFYCNLGSWLGEEKPYAIWDPETKNLPTILSANSLA